MDFLELLKSRLVFFDGATGTELSRRGLPLGHCTEEWNLSHPDEVLGVHQSYKEVGCDAVTTNSLGGSRIKLARFGFEDRVREINSIAVTLAKEAMGVDGFAAGSIGPTGELLKPYGTLEPEEAKEVFREQAGAMAAAGVDLFVIETMIDLNEALLAVEAAREAGDVPVVASITFQIGPSGPRTIMGSSPADVVGPLLDAGASVVGSNCGGGPEEMRQVVEEFHRVTSVPLIAEPNAGIPRVENGLTVFPAGPEEMAEAMADYPELGVRAIGGCCGSTPDHIRRIISQFGRS